MYCCQATTNYNNQMQEQSKKQKKAKNKRVKNNAQKG